MSRYIAAADYSSGDEGDDGHGYAMSSGTKSTLSVGCECALEGCKSAAACLCKGCQVAAYCSAEHQAKDWENHHVACNLNISCKLIGENCLSSGKILICPILLANLTKALWTTEEEIGHAVGDADEKWVACDLVHAHLGQNGLIGQPLSNSEVVQARNEHIEGFATFGAESTLARGTQRLPSGSMHRGETVEMYIEIGGVRAEITGIKLPQSAHYNIFRANKGYNVFLSQRDIQASRKFRTVPASGSVFVGLGTAEQKSLIFG